MNRLGFTTPLKKDLLAYTDTRGRLLGIDRTAHCATFVLASLIIDRDGEIVHPRGCLKRLGTYKRNPIVLYDHEGMPIGLSQTPAGACTIRMEGEDLVGTCYYHLLPGTPGKLSRDVWAMVECEPAVIRMASVGFIPHDVRPIDTRILRPDGKGGIRARSGNEYTDWEMTEWSNTPLGANQQALRLDLKRMSPVIRKSFSVCFSGGIGTMPNMATLKKRYGKDKFSKRQAAAAFKKIPGIIPDDWYLRETAKAWTFVTKAEADKEKEDDEGDDEAPEAAVEPVEKEETPAEDKPEGKPVDEKVVLKDMANHHQALADYAKEVGDNTYHPGVKALLDEHGAHAGEMVKAIHEAAAEHYPDLDFAKFCKSEETPEHMQDEEIEAESDDDDAIDDFEEEEPEEKPEKRVRGAVTKKYHLKSAHAACIKDAHEFLDDMGGNDAVPKSFRGGCKFHAGELTKVLHGNGDTGREGHLEKPEADDEESQMEKTLRNMTLKFG